MDETKYNSIKIDGMGNYPGGNYNDVSISGSAKFEGDLQCKYFSTSGISTVTGNLTCQTFKTSGKSKVQGCLTTEKFDLSGMLNCYEDFEAKNSKITGMLTVGGKLNSNELINYGLIKVKQEVNSETISVTGVLDCEGLLNCERFQIELNGTSKIKEIGAGQVDVRKGNSIGGFITKIFGPKRFKLNQLETDLMEADEIYIENTVAKMVRGKNITIGPNCIIDFVEYRDTITINELSTVKNKMQI